MKKITRVPFYIITVFIISILFFGCESSKNKKFNCAELINLDARLQKSCNELMASETKEASIEIDRYTMQLVNLKKSTTHDSLIITYVYYKKNDQTLSDYVYACLYTDSLNKIELCNKPYDENSNDILLETMIGDKLLKLNP
jgi:hypothetical protein